MPDEILSTPAARRRFWLAVGLLALGLQGALLWLEWRPQPRPLWGDEITYWDAAVQVRAGQAPDLHLLWPPLYPRFLAALMPLSHGTRLAAQLVQIALLAVAALCLRGLGRALLPAAAASAPDIAAALLVLDPQVAAFTVYLWPELLHLALFLFAWWALATRAGRWPWLVAAGGALGLALLTKSLLVAFLPVLLAPLVLAGPPRQRLMRPALVLGALMLVILPTLLAHRARYGVAAIADSSLFNAWVGLNDRSHRSFVHEIVGDELGLYLRSAPEPRGREAVVRGKIAGLVEERGVWRLLRAQLGRQYFRLFHHDSFFTEQLPGGGIAAVKGYGYLAPPGWLATALRVWAAALYGGVLIAAAFAVAAVSAAPAAPAATEPGARRGWLAVAVLFVAYNLALFLVLHVMSRYRVQFMPVLDLGAGATVAWAWQRSRPRRPAVAWVAGGGLAAGLIFLAFGGQ